MPAIADSLFGFLDSRYDEKYGRCRSLFFYRSGMTSFDSRLIISLLDSRYDEKYGRWRSLFFYRSGMTHF